MAGALRYYRTAERPDLQLWLLDENEALVNLSAGYTFVFKLGTEGATAAFTKTTGMTGAAGSGTESSGTPNLTLTFIAAELDNVPAGFYTWQVRATTSGLDRVWQGDFYLEEVVL